MSALRFNILDRYIGKELVITWLSVTVVLMVILLSGTFAQLLNQAAKGAIPGDTIFMFLLYTSAQNLIFLLPFSLYLGILMCFGRLYKDNEMAALGACGVGYGQMYRIILTLAIPVSILMLIMTLFTMPWLIAQGQLLRADIENRSELSGLMAGRFNPSSDGRSVLFMERQSSDGKQMKNVFLQQNTETGQSVETADSARKFKDEHGRNFILFEKGRYYQGQAGEPDFTLVEYEKHGVYLPENSYQPRITRKNALPTSVIWQSTNLVYKAELQWRFSLPLATLLLAILALPLSYTTPRKGRYSKILPAIVIYLVYSNFLGIGQKWMETGKLPEWLGLWWVHGGALLLIITWWTRRMGGLVSTYKWMHKHP